MAATTAASRGEMGGEDAGRAGVPRESAGGCKAIGRVGAGAAATSTGVAAAAVVVMMGAADGWRPWCGVEAAKGAGAGVAAPGVGGRPFRGGSEVGGRTAEAPAVEVAEAGMAGGRSAGRAEAGGEEEAAGSG